ncbi:MAG TPA: efflux RND transporter periplasmic adaptor subunit [Verrucomicrobiae bacterium]|nr:efflux RND transporter periplasmic adaptor subunit [Verrucomicrobiae bacterium]
MNDKSALLGQLKIDRSLEPASSGNAGKWIAIGAGVIALGVGAVVWLKPAAAVAVQAAAAIPASSASASPASVLDASGYVIARRQATVSAKLTGKVVELNIEEGKAVKAGQVLARLDDSNANAQLALAESQLGAAKAAQAEVQVQLIEGERQLRRSRELHERKLVSDAALDNAQSTVDSLKARAESAAQQVGVASRGISVQRRFLDDTVVRAPFDGVITVKNAQVGEMISPLSAGGAGTRTGIGTLVDMASLEIEVDVNENFINRVQPGQRVEAILNAYPDWKIPCAVIAVIPTADRSKATVKVRIGIQVRDARIIPDMGVRVSFLPEEEVQGAEAAKPQGVLVPAAAIKDEGGTKVVFVITGETVERRAVGVGAERGGQVNVTAGLSGGERVALGELEKLQDGARVEVQK